MTDLVTWVCAECGGDDVVKTMDCEWDFTLQEWVGNYEVRHQDLFCSECSHRQVPPLVKLVERPLNLKEIAQVAITKQEATQ